jgi:hypothetical protein
VIADPSVGRRGDAFHPMGELLTDVRRIAVHQKLDGSQAQEIAGNQQMVGGASSPGAHIVSVRSSSFQTIQLAVRLFRSRLEFINPYKTTSNPDGEV